MSDFTQDPFDIPSDFVERVMFSRRRKPLGYITIPYAQSDAVYAGMVTNPTIIPYAQSDQTKVL